MMNIIIDLLLRFCLAFLFFLAVLFLVVQVAISMESPKRKVGEK